MAVIHPEDRIVGLDRARSNRPRKLHPAFGLAIGFGFIFAASTVVHLLFAAF
ncbi:MAG: hypothetical protein ACK4NU_07460 [Brevundimonas sp.]|uniref:hypothetical protein n=1 Tax=Brevundimonas sp. TaxID=1871086 RepID=UPI0027284D64|nr:hypothetical protein [Brevundimonas sp.]MDO9608372.1 hypothetical protein [Brevundimonas sp.]